MRLSLRIEGGLAYFPGLAREIVVDSETLSAEERERLEQLVAAADLPTAEQRIASPARGRADVRTYVLRVEDAGGVTRLDVPEPVRDEALRELIDFLRARRQRAE